MSLIVSSDPPDSLMSAGLGSRRLVSVPEDTTLRIPEDDEVKGSEQQPQCPPATRPVSLISEAEVRGHPRPVTKAEPVTASQQISLWLLRSSAQDLGDWSAVGSLRNMLGLQSKGRRQQNKMRKESVLRKCETDVKFRIESDGEEEEDSDVEDSPGKEDRVRKKSSVKDTQGALLKHLARKGASVIDIYRIQLKFFQLEIRQRRCIQVTS